jgi:hypothetical protein
MWCGMRQKKKGGAVEPLIIYMLIALFMRVCGILYFGLVGIT